MNTWCVLVEKNSHWEVSGKDMLAAWAFFQKNILVYQCFGICFPEIFFLFLTLFLLFFPTLSSSPSLSLLLLLFSLQSSNVQNFQFSAFTIAAVSSMHILTILETKFSTHYYTILGLGFLYTCVWFYLKFDIASILHVWDLYITEKNPENIIQRINNTLTHQWILMIYCGLGLKNKYLFLCM
jgi:hypothetical protein